jgi:hypothetical protein
VIVVVVVAAAVIVDIVRGSIMDPINTHIITVPLYLLAGLWGYETKPSHVSRSSLSHFQDLQALGTCCPRSCIFYKLGQDSDTQCVLAQLLHINLTTMMLQTLEWICMTVEIPLCVLYYICHNKHKNTPVTSSRNGLTVRSSTYSSHHFHHTNWKHLQWSTQNKFSLVCHTDVFIYFSRSVITQCTLYTCNGTYISLSGPFDAPHQAHPTQPLVLAEGGQPVNHSHHHQMLLRPHP